MKTAIAGMFCLMLVISYPSLGQTGAGSPGSAPQTGAAQLAQKTIERARKKNGGHKAQPLLRTTFARTLMRAPSRFHGQS
jgi:hypothetical protein